MPNLLENYAQKIWTVWPSNFVPSLYRLYEFSLQKIVPSRYLDFCANKCLCGCLGMHANLLITLVVVLDFCA